MPPILVGGWDILKSFRYLSHNLGENHLYQEMKRRIKQNFAQLVTI